MSVCSACGKDNHSGARFCNWCGEGITGSKNSVTGLLPSQALLYNGRYMIIARVGQGGMGAVYKALDLHEHNTVVAIKEMSQSGLSGNELQHAIDAFRREAQILAGLQHHSLPRIHQQFVEDERRYLVMEFIEGETLEHWLQNLKQQDQTRRLKQALALGLQLCAVLEYLHTQKPPIIFRDLKPGNVMLTAQGQVYLIDFGIARLFKAGQQKDTVALGSPGYAPPEQYRKSTSPRSDIYSLGATLHQLLSGVDPSENPFQFQALSLPISALDRLIMSMVAMDEETRPLSMQEVHVELLRIAQQLQSSARAAKSRQTRLLVDSAPATISTTPAPSTDSALPEPPPEPLAGLQSIRIYAITAASVQDQRLWQDVEEQFRSLMTTFPQAQMMDRRVPQGGLIKHMQAVELADIVICCVSDNFLHSADCMLAVQRAVDLLQQQTLKVFSVLLRPCDWQASVLTQIPMITDGAVAHLSVYAQEQRVQLTAKALHTQLSNILLASARSGPMSLAQWLLWQLYGNGGRSCPYFVVGNYALRYVRPSGRDGVVFYLYDLQRGRAIADYIVGTHNRMHLATLIEVLAPTRSDPEQVQGVAMRVPPEVLVD